MGMECTGCNQLYACTPEYEPVSLYGVQMYYISVDNDHRWPIIPGKYKKVNLSIRQFKLNNERLWYCTEYVMVATGNTCNSINITADYWNQYKYYVYSRQINAQLSSYVWFP